MSTTAPRHSLGTTPVQLPAGTKVYVAGPMSGVPDYNYPAFRAAAAELEAAGFAPLDPSRGGLVDGWEWRDYMAAGITDLVTCRGIHMLANWRHSKGARIEASLAMQLDIKPVDLSGTVLTWASAGGEARAPS